MAKLLNLSIDVTKIDKSKLIAGKKGTYLNLTIALNDDADQFGNDVSSWQGQDQAEREANERKNYLGNGRVFWSGSTVSNQQNSQAQTATENLNNQQEDTDDLPF